MIDVSQLNSESSEVGTVYILHFQEPYKHAAHYVGFSTNLTYRLAHHANGTGARLMQVVSAAGIRWVLASAQSGTRSDERKLKNRKNTRKVCPICTGKVKYVCYECGKTYVYPGWLRRHCLTKHRAIHFE